MVQKIRSIGIGYYELEDGSIIDKGSYNLAALCEQVRAQVSAPVRETPPDTDNYYPEGFPESVARRERRALFVLKTGRPPEPGHDRIWTFRHPETGGLFLVAAPDPEGATLRAHEFDRALTFHGSLTSLRLEVMANGYADYTGKKGGDAIRG